MLSKKIIITLVLILLPLQLFGATTGKISGVIKDAESGDPLPGANVIIDGTMMGASSNLEGYYYIINVPPGYYNVKAQMMGYQTIMQKEVLVRVGLTTDLRFELSQTVLDLGNVVEVTAERPIVQKDLTSGRSIITSEDIKEMPVESFQAVLSTKAGVTTGANGAMHIRGGRSNEIAYMIDGIPISNPFWGGLAVQVENSGIQELQVVSGTFNAEYGQAMSGVVNIVTKEGRNDLHGNLQFYVGDRISNNDHIFPNIKDIDPMGQYNFDMSLDGPVPFLDDRVTFFATARYYNESGYIYGIREHLPGDGVYLDDATAQFLAFSPYNTEPYFDANENGKFDEGEPFLDTNRNNIYDDTPGRINFFEPYEDLNRNGQFDPMGDPFTDLNGNNVYDPGEPFEDVDNNGFYSEADPFSITISMVPGTSESAVTANSFP